ncbi:NAD-dependent epimerase/dehydratase family protein [Allochromatium humboldtianum]|uniref:NAD-dependent epimerase/dehydratase family protein n=1 Tax=Allochromatium humboldtianum TaxID=504901 RepID=A0A850RQI9_9GAMM|nr:NAD-dependent epimerase/dehydratase family protein [Allochromatium humboldtianum]NVZ11801.1 NAD-dependent epimerase/dehydratase family protein [Allochromatium humboldtianum]
MKILINGGRGNISWSLTQLLAKKGHSVVISAKNKDKNYLLPKNVELLFFSGNSFYEEANKKLDFFDCVVDFICYNEKQAMENFESLKEKVSHYFFVSSVTVYSKPSLSPISELSKKNESKWSYARGKQLAEEYFQSVWEKFEFPVTIVRPSHTYSSIFPVNIGNGDWTIPNRILNKKAVLLSGNGTSLWTLTHSNDFAEALYMLIEKKAGIGEDFNIVSDFVYTWNDIYNLIAEKIEAPSKPKIKYISASDLMKNLPYYAPSVVFEKQWDGVYDTSKLKKVIPEWKSCINLTSGLDLVLNFFSENKSLLIKTDQVIDKFMDQF